MKLTDTIERHARWITKGALAILLLWGLAMVLFAIRPFWHDEWRLIYNLKFKTSRELWGDLEYTQQFPRVYLQLTKAFTHYLDYNYFSLRFPAFFIGLLNVFFCWTLMKRIYIRSSLESYLFVMMTVSNFTFIEYLVQTKHYQMEILMSLVALWQALQMIHLSEKGVTNRAAYTLLSLSFFVAPFFSYTYPIAVAPVYLVVLVQLISARSRRERVVAPILQMLPLLFSFSAIYIFYVIDVRQLMADEEMRQFWKFRMASEGGREVVALKNLWGWFAKMGSGFLFENLFGIVGIVSVAYALRKAVPFLRKPHPMTPDVQLRLYCIGLVITVLILFFAGKLPLSEPKFNAFTIPALSILIGYFLCEMKRGSYGRFYIGVATLLFCALVGNVVTSVINTFTLPEYKKRIAIYEATQAAVLLAQASNIPILISPGVAYPDDINSHMPGMQLITADDVLKAFPAYDARQRLKVIPIKSTAPLPEVLHALPDSFRHVLIGDGLKYSLYRME